MHPSFEKLLQDPPSPREHREKAREALLDVLYETQPRAMLATLAAATLFWWIVSADDPLLTLWWVLMSATAVARLGIGMWRRRHPHALDHRGWHRLIAVGALTTAALWGSTFPLFFAQAEPSVQLFIGLIGIGVSASVVQAMAADLRLVLIYLYLAVGPAAFTFFRLDDPIHQQLGWLTLLYLASITIGVRKYHHTLLEAVRQRLALEQAHHELAIREREIRRLFEHTPTGLFYYDRALRLIDCNEAFARTLKAARDRLIGLDMNRLRDQRILPTLRAALDDRSAHYEGPYHTLLGRHELWGDIHTAPVHDEQGRVVGGIGAIQDRTREHRALQEITRLALYDPLTGLPNRKLLVERIEHALRHARRSGERAALLYLDLDDFKRINDSLGHERGDRLLCQFSRRIQGILREEDTLARLGGDEFVVLTGGLGDDTESAMHHGLRVAEKILSLCADPFDLDGHAVYTSPSIGLVLLDGSADAGELLRRADTAMYRAKELGKRQTAFYDPVMDDAARRYASTVQYLRAALADRAFELHFQPVVSGDGRRVCSAEALIRWKGAPPGRVAPAHFIAIAEESNLISPIGQWVIDACCRQIAEWERAGWPPHLEHVSFNASPRELQASGYIDWIRSCLEHHRVAPRRLRVEVTESTLAQDPEQMRATLEALRELGIPCAIDDFGSGCSSLAWLRRLPVSTLKIDREYVWAMEREDDADALIRIMIEIARQFGYEVIAEGVETPAQLDSLRALSAGMRYQGNLFSPPLVAGDFYRLAREGPPPSGA